jgi:DtxR family Mn-dependent transcriptional regulator
LELEEEGITPMRARIAERLEHSGPTVSQTIARMERDGLLTLSDDRQLQFTDQGRQKAIEVMRKHRIAERLLVDVIGLDWELVHEEACRWEHVMSEQVEHHILGLLQERNLSPFGMPIPGLELLGLPPATYPEVQSVAQTTQNSGILSRIGEPIQLDIELLRQFRDLGLTPGTPVNIGKEGDSWLITAETAQEGLILDLEIASHVFITNR